MSQTLWERESYLKCPIHEVEMYYWPYGDLYACQNIDCQFAGGVTKEVIIAYFMGN